MRKTIFSLLIVSVTCFVNAQTKLTYQTHGIQPGDVHEFIMTNHAPEGLAGKNVIWDFSSLKPSGVKLSSFMLSSSDIPQNPTNMGNSVIQENGNNFIFKGDKKGLYHYATIACNTTITYEKPFMKMKYPFEYGTSAYGTYSATQKNSNSNSALTGTYEISGDGLGTLLLPGNVVYENALRVKQVRTIQYQGSQQITKEVTYRWYVNQTRYPLLVIIQYVTGDNVQTVETALYAHASNQKKNSKALQENDLFNSQSVEVSPNPYQEQLFVKLNLISKGKVTIDIYDNLGRFITTLYEEVLDKGAQEITLNPVSKGLQSGNYYLRINTKEQPVTIKVIQL